MTDRYKRLAVPVAAVTFVAGVVVALTISNSPDTSASGAKVIAFYKAHRSSQIASTYLLAYAGLAALLYFASVANYLRRCGSDLLATLTVAGAAIFAGGIFLGVGANTALTDRPSHISADTAQTLNFISNDLFFVAMIAGLCAATVSMGVAMLRTGALPKALGIVTVIVGVVCGAGGFGWFGFMASGPLSLVIAGYVYQRMGRPAEITLPGMPAARAASEAEERSTASTA